ncbi:HlyD family secretion protein [Shewanella avicenniae]|uniref:HlyD family secretion protein n=1 Tax=Shewanella avicenniae TaxID=2814294 RepID=A0ABX7QNU8_9GAMM|nr:HlyD family secretion protein [Shewanella avicenniae]QSX33147.1 HlyD family secretion protein [Shewanella avicenniae]
MTPDQQFARIIKFAICGFVLLFGYFIFADMSAPLTPQAMATRLITKVAPQVSGKVVNVQVSNNQHVKQGQVLFEIDAAPYQLALQQAQLNLEQALQDNAELDAQIAAAKATVIADDAALEQAQREARRLHKLVADNSVSRQSEEQSFTDVKTAQASLDAARATLRRLQVSRGSVGEDNLRLRLAKNQLAQAKLNLSYTQVKADQDGVVSNLQLQQGSVLSANAPVMALVSDQLDVIADFREKTIRNVAQGYRAYVTFDGDPGMLYAASVSSIDAGVSAGQFSADGSLAAPEQSNRWVRDAQRLRLHFTLEHPSQRELAAGARATVQLLPESGIMHWFAKAQIKFIALLHYIY